MAAIGEVYTGLSECIERLEKDGMMGTGTVMILIGGRERKINVKRLTGLGVEEVISLVREKQERWKVFIGRGKGEFIALGLFTSFTLPCD